MILHGMRPGESILIVFNLFSLDGGIQWAQLPDNPVDASMVQALNRRRFTGDPAFSYQCTRYGYIIHDTIDYIVHDDDTTEHNNEIIHDDV
jgi:hypothetical protein